MTTQAGRLDVFMGLDTTGFEGGLRQAGARTLQFQRDVSNAMTGVSTSVDRSAASMRSLRGRMQEVGFQSQDAIVQLQQGVRWTQILVQQGSQLAGAFGPSGAIIGAVGAGLIIAGDAAYRYVTGANDAAESQKRLADELKASQKTIADTASGVSDLIEKYQQLSASGRTVEQLKIAGALGLSQKDIETTRKGVSDLTDNLEAYAKVAQSMRDVNENRGVLGSSAVSGRQQANFIDNLVASLKAFKEDAISAQQLLERLKAEAAAPHEGFVPQTSGFDLDKTIQQVTQLAAVEQQRRNEAARAAAQQNVLKGTAFPEEVELLQPGTLAGGAASQAGFDVEQGKRRETIHQTLVVLGQENAAIEQQTTLLKQQGATLDAKAKKELDVAQAIGASKAKIDASNEAQRLGIAIDSEDGQQLTQLLTKKTQLTAAESAYQAALKSGDTGAKRASDAVAALQRENDAVQAEIKVYKDRGVVLSDNAKRDLEVKEQIAGVRGETEGQNKAAQLDIDLKSQQAQKIVDLNQSLLEGQQELQAYATAFGQAGQTANASLDAMMATYKKWQQEFKGLLFETPEEKRAQDEARRVREQAANDVQQLLTETIDQGLAGNLQSVKDFWDGFEAISRRALANVASNFLMQPFNNLIATGNFGTATLGSTFSGLQGTGVANVGLGSVLAAGALGTVGGGLGGRMLGLNQTGSSFGGGIGAAGGAILGSVFPGVGTLAGSVIGGVGGSLFGGVLGGMFGGQKNDPNNNFGGLFNPVTGRFTAGAATNPDPGMVSAITALGQTLSGFVTSLKAMGASVGLGTLNLQGGLHQGFQVNGQAFGTADQAGIAAMRQLVLGSTGLLPGMATVARTSQATTADEFLKDLAVPQTIQDLLHPLDQFAQSLHGLEAQFKAAADSAEQLGLSTAGLSDAADTAIQTAVRQTIGPALQALRGLGIRNVDPSQFRVADIGGSFTLNGQPANTADEASIAAMRSAVLASPGGLAGTKQVARVSGATTADQFLQDLAIPQTLQDLLHPMDQFAASLKTLDQQFRDAREGATRLGLSTAGLAQAQDAAIQGMLHQAIAPALAGLRSIGVTGADPNRFRVAGDDQGNFTLNGQRVTSADQASIIAMRQSVLSSRDAGVLAGVRGVATRSRATTASEFAADLAVPQQLHDLLHPLDAFGNALRQLVTNFTEVRTAADRLGLSTTSLAAAEEDAIQTLLKQQRDQAVGSVQQALGGFDQLLSPINAFQGSLKIGTTASSNPLQRLAATRAQFGQAAAAAAGPEGNAQNMSDLVSLGQELLTTSQGVNASGVAYQQDFAYVNRTISDLQKQLQDSRDDFLRSIPQEIRTAAQSTVEQLKALVALAQQQVDLYMQANVTLADVRRRAANT